MIEALCARLILQSACNKNLNTMPKNSFLPFQYHFIKVAEKDQKLASLDDNIIGKRLSCGSFCYTLCMFLKKNASR